jgi:uncharacterized radical SAM protein YgiQ
MERKLFLPTSKKDFERLKWDKADIILITSDAYIDSPYIGVSIIGRLLTKFGYKVAIISQPNINSDEISKLSEPKLFWGISGGSVDSMVANYTASFKKRKNDDFTPGGQNNKRPDRAVIAYSNLIRRYFKNTVPIVLGGVEASLRRVVHYDFWSNKLRKSILFDAKADYILYGMAEQSIIEFASKLKNNDDIKNIRGLCYISNEIPKNSVILPSFDECKKNQDTFIEMFHKFYEHNDPITGKTLAQKHDTRFLIQNPPAKLLTSKELDSYYELDFTYKVHPDCLEKGYVKAIDTINNSITTHRGCYGECNFCSIAVHQGTTVVSRTEKSILNEALRLTKQIKFNGIIRDVGGPTANMYNNECIKKIKHGRCKNKRCLYPDKCSQMPTNHKKITSILRKIRNIDKIKKVFVASGIRYDLILDDKENGDRYLDEIIKHHISGQMKIAPEHSEKKVLSLMGKPDAEILRKFVRKFYEKNKKTNKKQYLTYYLIAAHPGCTFEEMKKLKKFANKEFKVTPEQVQIFTPLPSTYSALMYYTEKNPWTNEKIFVEKDKIRKIKQKEIITK